MKATLEFDLPDDNLAYKVASNHLVFADVVWNLERYLEGLKYVEDSVDPDTLKQELIDILSTAREVME